MNLTKEEISDLRALQSRVIECTLNVERCDLALKQAQAHLESLLWRFEHQRGTPQEKP